MKASVLGLVDDAHSAAAEFLDDAVVRNSSPDHCKKWYVRKTGKSTKHGMGSGSVLIRLSALGNAPQTSVIPSNLYFALRAKKDCRGTWVLPAPVRCPHKPRSLACPRRASAARSGARDDRQSKGPAALEMSGYFPLARAAFTFDSRSCDRGCTGPGILAASVSASRASLTRFSLA